MFKLVLKVLSRTRFLRKVCEAKQENLVSNKVIRVILPPLRDNEADILSVIPSSEYLKLTLGKPGYFSNAHEFFLASAVIMILSATGYKYHGVYPVILWLTFS